MQDRIAEVLKVVCLQTGSDNLDIIMLRGAFWSLLKLFVTLSTHYLSTPQKTTTKNKKRKYKSAVHTAHTVLWGEHCPPPTIFLSGDETTGIMTDGVLLYRSRTKAIYVYSHSIKCTGSLVIIQTESKNRSHTCLHASTCRQKQSRILYNKVHCVHVWHMPLVSSLSIAVEPLEKGHHWDFDKCP